MHVASLEELKRKFAAANGNEKSHAEPQNIRLNRCWGPNGSPRRQKRDIWHYSHESATINRLHRQVLLFFTCGRTAHFSCFNPHAVARTDHSSPWFSYLSPRRAWLRLGPTAVCAGLAKARPLLRARPTPCPPAGDTTAPQRTPWCL
jgi:hypothetical protein